VDGNSTMNKAQIDDTGFDNFCLPTQESSSSDDDDSSDEESKLHNLDVTPAEQGSCNKEVALNSLDIDHATKDAGPGVEHVETMEGYDSDDSDIIMVRKLKAQRSIHIDDSDNEATESVTVVPDPNGIVTLEDTDESVVAAPCHNQASRKRPRRIAAILDSPESVSSQSNRAEIMDANCSKVDKSSLEFPADTTLSNTQEDDLSYTSASRDKESSHYAPGLKRLKRLRLTTDHKPSSNPCPTTALAKDRPKRKTGMQRRMHYRRFLDDEAEVDSESDIDGDDEEEDDIDAIEEEEEFHRSFINDSTQLGYTPDPLDKVDPHAADDAVYRELDFERAKEHALSTPILNRRMRRRTASGDVQLSAPDTAQGLGSMHFIRRYVLFTFFYGVTQSQIRTHSVYLLYSVIEFHRNGGDAEELEEAYNQIEIEETSSIDEEVEVVPEPPLPKKMVWMYSKP
jgi:hypothetical protein